MDAGDLATIGVGGGLVLQALVRGLPVAASWLATRSDRRAAREAACEDAEEARLARAEAAVADAHSREVALVATSRDDWRAAAERMRGEREAAEARARASELDAATWRARWEELRRLLPTETSGGPHAPDLPPDSA